MRKRQKSPEKNRNKKKAHLLLGAFWIGNVLNGKSVSETTLQVMQIEKNSLKKEYTNKLRTIRSKDAGDGVSVKKAAAGVLAWKALRKILNLILKAQRVV